MQFFKYQSLGNDFILFDFYSNKEPSFFNSDKAKKICDRRFGIGADGVLILTKKSFPKIEIFNADGTNGEMCLNGLRCVALHLFTKHNFPSNFKIEMSSKLINCRIEKNLEIQTNIELSNYKGKKTITISNVDYIGHVALAPNPHFIVFKKVPLEWLKNNGQLFERHESFPHGTNVEFIWKNENNKYEMLVYERGCGITLSCGSGTIAAFTTLLKLKKIDAQVDTIIKMPGGSLKCGLYENKINLKSAAFFIFSGQIK
ncbi:diaminopimelate epimerase [Candidatus Babeliales bacterium]|nr:diaminopimelate epimerase [Candidatus Babeliales bacterium]